MDPIDDLQARWSAAPVPNLPTDITHTIRQQHRRHLRSVVWMSGGFALTYMVLVWVWMTNPDRGWAFNTSILLMGVLLAGMLLAQWSAVTFGNPSATLRPADYARSLKRKLRLRHFLLGPGIVIYGVLFMAILFLYYTDVLSQASGTFRLWAHLLTVAYVAGVGVFSIPTCRRKRAEIRQLLDGLTDWTA